MEPQAASPEAGEEPERIKKCSGLAFSEYPRAHPGWRVLRDVPQESCRGVQHRWEAQWQEFLETVPSPPMMWESPELTEMAPWEDAKAFLASFEQVAKACQWPRGEWAARLQPALSGEAKQAFSNLEAGDREDYGKVKAAILREDAIKMEVQRQHFRQFRYEELDEPRRIHCQLQELCHRWLRPERRSKEQILELLILEQFLASLPSELQGWIRAGGPDTCSQAVALAEDFLMSQQEAEREKWQEPLPEMTKISPEAEKTSTVVLPKKVQKGAKQNRSRDSSSLDSGNQGLRDPSSLLSPPDELEIAENDLTEVPVNFRETEVSRHMVEPTPAPPGQQTMFWQVMQEEDGDAESLEGLLVPKPELASRPEEAEEEMFISFPAASKRLPGQASGDERRSWMKREISREAKSGGPSSGLSPWVLSATMAEVQEQRCDGERSRLKMETSEEVKMGTLGELSQWNVPATAALHEQRCENSSSVKMENTQQGEAGMPALTETKPWNPPLTVTLYEQRFEPNQELERMHLEEDEGSSRFSEDLSVAVGENAPAWDSRPKKLLVSKYGRKCNYRLGLVMKHPTEDHYGHPMPSENIQDKTSLFIPQRIQPGKKVHDGSECGRGFQPRPKLVRCQKVPRGGNPYECLECGKSFISRGTLMVHQIIHTGEKPFGCPQCGKCFNQRTNLLRHQRIHTGEKVHECPKCGKKFYRKDKLILHQRVHTGEKPYECLQCRKSFTAKEKLLRHQRIHLGY